MSRWWGIVLVGLAVACNGGAPKDPIAPVEPTPVSEPAPDAVPADLPEVADMPVAEPEPVKLPDDPSPDPTEPGVEGMPMGPPPTSATLYEACRDRVEMPETAGECKTSADCGSGGCSGEMCVARSLGAITSTCEVRACFGVLDTCGCVDGKCQWSLKASPPERRTAPPLDVQ